MRPLTKINLCIVLTLGALVNSQGGGSAQPTVCQALPPHTGALLNKAAQDPSNSQARAVLREVVPIKNALDNLYRSLQEMDLPPRDDLDRTHYPGGDRQSDLRNTSYILVRDDAYADAWMRANRPIALAVARFGEQFPRVLIANLQTRSGAFTIRRQPRGVAFDVFLPGLLIVEPKEKPGYNIIQCDEHALGVKWVSEEESGDPRQVYIFLCLGEQDCVQDSERRDERRFWVEDWLRETAAPRLQPSGASP